MRNRQPLHALVDERPDAELPSAQRSSDFLSGPPEGPLEAWLASVPVDDEPLTAEDEAALLEGLEAKAKGDVVQEVSGVATAAAPPETAGLPLGLDVFEAAYARVAPHAHHTPLLSSHTLSELTGCEVRLKAELFQRTGSYKLRGPLNKLTYLTADERRRGVVCSSAGNHAQGLALAAKIYGIAAVVVMAENATPSKIAATRGYGAEVVLHGTIWDEANEKAKELVRDRGLTYIHPFDDLQLIAGQGTVGLEIVRDWPEVDVVVVPIGGGGLISGVSMAIKAVKPTVRIIGVESSGAPGMRDSVAAGHVVKLPKVDSIIDGLRVGRVGETTFQVVRRFVDDIVTLPDDEIFDAMLWLWSRAKLVVEGAAAAPVAALLHGLVRAPEGARIACVLSGGNVNLDPIRGRKWN